MTRRRRTYRRSPKASFCTVSFDGGACKLHFGKPRQTVLHEMRTSCPNFLRAIELLHKVSKGEEVDVSEVLVPASEILALSVYLAATATRIEGWDDEEGKPLDWRALSEEERVDFIECLPVGWSQQCFGQLLMAMAFEDNPELEDRLTASAREPEPDVGEEE